MDVSCPNCAGSGTVFTDGGGTVRHLTPCPRCLGSRLVTQPAALWPGHEPAVTLVGTGGADANLPNIVGGTSCVT